MTFYEQLSSRIRRSLCCALAAAPAAAAEVPFATGSTIDGAFDGAFAVVAADLDRDGDLDVVGAATLADDVTWWENTAGDGSAWTEHTIDGSENGPRSVDAADVDGDGDLDVLAAAFDADDVSWYENTAGDGSAWTQHGIDGSFDGATSVFAADVDGDGDTDVVAAASNADDVTWWENDGGTGGQWIEHTIDGAFDGATSVAAADLDGDGDADVLAAALLADDVTWWENTAGDGSAWSEHTIDGDFNEAVSVAAADVDGDGDTDVLATGISFVAWWENSAGDGSAWTERSVGSAGGIPASVAAADLDGDGDTDLLTAIAEVDDVSWWENTVGDGSAWTEHIVDGNFEDALSVAAADLDGDGDLDVLAAATTADDVTWWENETIHRSAAWPAAFETTIDGAFDGAFSTFAADVDGDGDLDVLAAAVNADDVTWWENTAGDGSAWTEHTVDGALDAPRSIFAADVDGDGDLDVLAASGGTADDVAWWENTAGDGSAWTERTVDANFDGGTSVFAADVDGDGDLDVLGAALTADQVSWWENTSGDGTAWTETSIDGNFDGAYSVVAADLDGDGDLDVLGAAVNGDDVSWWENTLGDGSAWTEHAVDGAFDGAISVRAADLDGDGDLDVLGAAENADDVAWWENTAGDGSAWTEHTIDGAFDNARTVFAADLDGDGDLDVLAGAAVADDVAWWENIAGDGSTWAKQTIDAEFDGPRLVVAADLDGDGDLDALAAASVADDVAWWENRGGQLAFATTDVAPPVLTAEAALLRITATHRGRAGDHDAELATLELRVEEAPGDPLTAGEAAELNLQAYLDDGSGLFEAGTDTPLAGGVSVTAGVLTGTFADGDADVQVPHGAPRTYFVTATPNPASSLTGVRVTHLTESSSTAEDRDADLPLELEYAADVASTPITFSADLAVTKSDGVTSAVPGGLLTYTLVASNGGPNGVAAAALTDAFPADLSCGWTSVAAGGATGNSSGSGNLADSLAMPAGSTVTYTATCLIDPGATGTLSNTASISSPLADPFPGNNSATDADTVLAPEADLSVTKTDGVTSAVPGGSLTYTIVAANDGPSDAPSVSVTDTFPADLTCVRTSVAAGGASGNTAGPGDLADTLSMPAGSSVTYTVSCDVDPGASGTLSNTASISSAVPDPDPGNDAATDADTVLTGAITVNSAGDATVSDDGACTLREAIAAANTDAASGPVAGECAAGGGGVDGIVFAIPGAGPHTLQPASALPAITAPVILDASTQNGADCAAGTLRIELDGQLAGDASGLRITGAGVTVRGLAIHRFSRHGIELSGAGSTGNVVECNFIGTDVTGTLAAGNGSDGVEIAGGAAGNTVGGTDPGAGNRIAANAGSGVSAGAAAITVEGNRIEDNAASGIALVAGGGLAGNTGNCLTGNAAGMTNTSGAATTADGNWWGHFTGPSGAAPGFGDSIGSGVTVDTFLTAPPAGCRTAGAFADLEVAVAESADPVTAGSGAGNLVYTVQVSNAGPDAAGGVRVIQTTTLPPGASLASVTPSAGAFTAPIWNLGSLAAGATATLTVAVTAGAATAPGTHALTHAAAITAAAATVTLIDPADDTAVARTSVAAAADLSLAKTDAADPAGAGTRLTYTLTAANAGPSNARGVFLTETLPAGVTLVATSGCLQDPAGVPSCSLGTLAAGASKVVTLTVTAPPDPGVITNRATVTSSTPEAAPGDETAAEETTVTGAADLAVTQTDSADPATAGSRLTYTLSVVNRGPSDALDVAVAESLPAGVTLVATAGCAEDPAGAPACTLGTLAAGATRQVAVTVDVDPATAGTLTSTAKVSSSTPEAAPGDETAVETTTVTGSADLAIAKTDGRTEAVPGEGAVYTVTVTNAGPSHVFGARVVDLLPPALTGASWTCAATAGSACTAGPVAGDLDDTADVLAGGTLTYTLTATVDPGAVGSLANTATVTAPAGVTDPNAADNSAADTDALTPRADLQVTKDSGEDAAVPGKPVVYTVTVANAGPSDAPGARLVDDLPAELVGVTWTCADSAGDPCPAAAGAGDLDETVGLPAGEKLTYRITGTAAADVTGTLSNTATVSAPAGVTDPDAGNDAATDADPIDPGVVEPEDEVDAAGGGQPEVAYDEAGGFLVVWEGTGAGGSPGGILARYQISMPLGSRFEVSKGASTLLTPRGVDPDVAYDPDRHEFLVVWEEREDAAPDESEIFGIRVEAGVPPGSESKAGMPLGSTFQVNSMPLGSELKRRNTAPSLAFDTAAGEFLVVWQGDAPGGVESVVRGRRVSSMPLGSDLTISSAMPLGSELSRAPAVAFDTDAREFLVVWDQEGADRGIRGQKVRAMPLGSQLQLSAMPLGSELQRSADVAFDPASREFHVVWQRDDPGSGDRAIFSRRVSAMPLGSDLRISASSSAAASPKVSSAFGNLAVVWEGEGDAGGGGADTEVFGRLLDADGQPRNIEFQVTQRGDDADDSVPAVAFAPSSADTAVDEFVVVWESQPPAGEEEILGQVFRLTADLALSHTDAGSDPAVAGDTVTYAVNVANAGPADAEEVVLTGALPPATSLVATAGCAEDPGGVPDCTLGTILAGASAQATVTLRVDPAARGEVRYAIGVASLASSDPDVTDNAAVETTTVETRADLSLSKTNLADPVPVGGTVTWVLTVDNAGSSDAEGVVVTETLPAGTSLVATSGCDEDPAGVPACTLDPIPAGGSQQVLVTARIDSAPAGGLVNSAAVAAATPDPDPADNAASETTTVSPSPAEVSGTMEVAGSFGRGTTVTYTALLTNAGPETQLDNPGDEFADVLPPELELLGATSSSGAVGRAATRGPASRGPASRGPADTVTWNGSIPAGGEVRITILAAIGNVERGRRITNQGMIFYDADGDGLNESSAPTESPEGGATGFTVTSTVVEIPTLGGLGLALLAGVLGALALAALRRRRISGSS